jgi:putative CocE/NonD family hydrolase
VPIYHESGWYDRYVRWTFRSFNGVRVQSRSDLARRSQKVIMGPWVHGGNVAPQTETVKFGPAAKIDRRALHLRWFDYWLKGIDTGIMQEPPVRVYLMGAERWLESDTWPLPNTTYRTFYLRSAGSARTSESLNDGRLLPEKPGAEPPDEYVHDPYSPISSIGGHGGFGGIWPAGPLDQRPAEARLLTFTTDTLTEDLQVVGEMRARFFASSSAVDTDFVLTLTNVYPNGYSAILRQNAVRGRYRETDEKEALLTPNQVYEFQLTLDGVANVFKAGHRLRLSIGSSSFPAFLPNPGTAAPMHLETRGVTAQNRIYHDAEHPSSIDVPVQPHAGHRTP